MRKIIGTIGATLVIVAFMATSAASAMADRQAPRIMLDPSADNTDVYASTALGNQGGGQDVVSGFIASSLVNTEPLGGSQAPSSTPVLAAQLT